MSWFWLHWSQCVSNLPYSTAGLLCDTHWKSVTYEVSWCLGCCLHRKHSTFWSRVIGLDLALPFSLVSLVSLTFWPFCRVSSIWARVTLLGASFVCLPFILASSSSRSLCFSLFLSRASKRFFSLSSYTHTRTHTLLNYNRTDVIKAAWRSLSKCKCKLQSRVKKLEMPPACSESLCVSAAVSNGY